MRENQNQTSKEDENFHTKENDSSPQEDRVSSAKSPSDSPKVGVGRRTSILFKKAKNGARLTKDKPVLLPNGVSKAQNGPSQEQNTPAKAPSTLKPASPFPHQLRSRGLSTCSDGEGTKAHFLPEENGTDISLLRQLLKFIEH